MTFDELLEEVYLITNRRSLVAETKSAIKRATLKAHKTDYYSKDIFEEGIEFANSSNIQTLDYIAMFANFRQWKYFKRVEDENDQLGVPIDIVSVDETLDSYGCNRTDIAYVAGRVLQIRSSVDFQNALVGCYVYPNVTEGSYRSWVADQYPFYIIHESANLIFRSIGKLEEAQAQTAFVREELAEIKIGATVDVGY